MSFTGIDDLRQRVIDRGYELVKFGGDILVDQVRTDAPVNTGRLLAGGEITAPTLDGDTLVSTLTWTAVDPESGVDYAEIQDKGSGIYGPTGRRIEGNPVLSFVIGGQRVTVRSVAGTPATGFFTNNVTQDAWTQSLEQAQ